MKNLLASFFIFLTIVTIIISVWFSNGKILSNRSEENLNIFNTPKSTKYHSTVWLPIGTGQKIPLNVQKYPTFLFLNQINKLEVEPFLIQAIFIGLIMVLGMTFMYLLLVNIFKLHWIYAIFGSIIYFLNLYSMSSIWKRLLYNHYIVWAYLPLFLLSWIKWIDTGRIRWLVLLLVSSIIFSYTFAHPAFILTFWITAGVFILYKLWLNKKQMPQVLKSLLYGAIGLSLWFIANIWWTYPFLASQDSYLENSTPSWQLNLSSLIGVSQYQSTKDIVLLRQSWVFNNEHEWYEFYSHPLIYLISISIFAIVIMGLIKSKDLKYRGFVITSLILGWFISKGSNFPLGGAFYTFLFSTFPQTAALRNPYEKFGPVYLLAYTILFVYGLYWLTKKFKSKISRTLFLGFSLFIFCGVLVYPMWTGEVFLLKDKVIVPDYYTKVNNYLNSISSKRSFSIPFDLNGAVIEYDWGYIGIDPSYNLFDSDMVSIARLPIFDNIYQKIPGFLANKNLPKLLGTLGVDNLILHADMNVPKIEVASASAMISNWQDIKTVKRIGKLTIYSLDKNLVKPQIFAVDSTVKVNSLDAGLNAILDGQLDLTHSVFVEDIDEVKGSNTPPQLTFTEESTTSYQVSIANAKGPFILVLNNTFDPNWQLKINGIRINQHFKVNGFANGWYVTKTGTYVARISLKIWPWQ